MRKFRFNLQRVLDYRETIEEKLLTELAAIRSQRDQELARLVEFTHARDLFREKMRRELAEGSSDDIKQAHRYLSQLMREVRIQDALVRRITERKDEKTAEVIEAAKDRKVLERLRDYKLLEHRREGETHEQKFLDDVASIRHNRRRSGHSSASGGRR